MKIFIYDEFSPQDTAMMQALYSRSAASVEEHAEKVKSSGSGKFMERYYVGYGHASIADCGSTTIFVEGVSMLAAKAIQDWPLYSGQETSSRYIDMSKQAIIDPLQTKESRLILHKWMDFYVTSQIALEVHLRQKYPKKETEDQVIYDKAIKARIFDIMRGFLPAGSTTQLSWHTNLRQAHDKLVLLEHHPLKEVGEAGKKIHDDLKVKYPNSFGHKIYPEQEAYHALVAKKYTYYHNSKEKTGHFSTTAQFKDAALKQYKDIVSKRPMKTNLPHFLTELGNLTFEFPLDFGSFRDVQRHRNGVCRMPYLTTSIGFHEWYINELPPILQKRAKELIKDQIKAIKALKASKEITQYYVAMGFMVSCKVSYGLPAAVYTMELRSGKLVHATLRDIAHKMYRSMKKLLPSLALHADLDKDDWDIRRGKQDIQEKK